MGQSLRYGSIGTVTGCNIVAVPCMDNISVVLVGDRVEAHRQRIREARNVEIRKPASTFSKVVRQQYAVVHSQMSSTQASYKGTSVALASLRAGATWDLSVALDFAAGGVIRKLSATEQLAYLCGTGSAAVSPSDLGSLVCRASRSSQQTARAFDGGDD